MKVDYRIMRLRCLAIIVVVLGHSIILYDPNWGGDILHHILFQR